ncbi:hypothetical protein R5H32_04235 [Defluviimonas sp. D31]|nr:hypothetical protein [Defluviimonas sp. D31]MDW4548556.1 hypothetical protein [Defluviimonas sp. D31]
MGGRRLEARIGPEYFNEVFGRPQKGHRVEDDRLVAIDPALKAREPAAQGVACEDDAFRAVIGLHGIEEIGGEPRLLLEEVSGAERPALGLIGGEILGGREIRPPVGDYRAVGRIVGNGGEAGGNFGA